MDCSPGSWAVGRVGRQLLPAHSSVRTTGSGLEQRGHLWVGTARCYWLSFASSTAILLLLNTKDVLFLSYYGPEEAASGIRAGRLARACSLDGQSVRLVHGASDEGAYTWRDGVQAWTFARPSIIEGGGRVRSRPRREPTQHHS